MESLEWWFAPQAEFPAVEGECAHLERFWPDFLKAASAT
jgi:hypothetical protein